MPSLVSAVAAIALLSAVLLVPHPPLPFVVPKTARAWWNFISEDLHNDEAIPRIFEGLIVIIVALIVFVVESVRSSETSDQKRLLLKISALWPLALLITLSPFAFLYPPATRLWALLAVGIATLVIISFGRVLQNLLDATASLEIERAYLRERVRSIVLESARERVGNRILFESLGEGKRIPFTIALFHSWLPGQRSDYAYVDAPRSGILTDVNLDELEALSSLVETQLQGDRTSPAATLDTESPVGPPRRSTPQQATARSYILRRYKEEVPEESIFGNDRAILAVPKQLAANRLLFSELRLRVAHIFKFSGAVTPSARFMREMQTTKDKLIYAIKSSALGQLTELRQTYLLVAEEFLKILNDLGGGYTADQALQERSGPFGVGQWSEVRWLVRDLRELVIVAAGSDNVEVIESVLYLPYAITVRALQVGDQLMFQEFVAFARLLYSLAAKKDASSPVRAYMTDRAVRYLREIAAYSIEPVLDAEDGKI